MNGTTGSSSGPRVAMPGMDVRVTYAGTPVKPAHIELTDSCGQVWQPPISSARDGADDRLARQARAAVRDLHDLRRLPVQPGRVEHQREQLQEVHADGSRPNTDFANAQLDHGRDHLLSTTGFC